MTANGSDHTPGTFDDVVRGLAALEVLIGKLGASIESVKIELKTVAPRLDTLTSEVRAASERVHRCANMVQVLTNETAELSQAKVAFEEALKEFRIDSGKRALELERTQRVFEHALTLVEGRVRQMRDDMADAIATNEEASGVKTRM